MTKSDKIPAKKQIEALTREIEQDQSKPLKPAEKPLKIHATFEKAVKAIIRAKPSKLKE